MTSVARGYGWRGWLGIDSIAMERAELPERERRSLAEQFGVPLEEVPHDYGAYLRFIKEKGAEIYYNTTMALLYQIDPERIDDALEPLELQPLLQVLTADADYLVLLITPSGDTVMDKTFDLVVVGTGAAASTVANRCRAAGWSVAIIDELPYGGTCQLRGCDPKKVLRRGAEVVDAARLLHGKGVADPGLRIDWPALMRFKRSFTDPVPVNKEKAFADKGIATYRGTARFVTDDAIEVGGVRLEARHVVIASGAEPVPLPIPGAEHVTTSDAFLELDELPRRVLFIGGGYISFEFAHIAARADAEVIVLDRGERPLKAFDPDLVTKLLERTRALGVDFRAKAAVEAIERSGAGLSVTAEIAGRSETYEADLVVHGAGRAPALERLDLERGNVRADKKGVTVNEFLQSVSNPQVYAAGDAAATAGAPLTPVASLEGTVVATNLLEGNIERPDYTGVPSAVFTIPELTRVGLDEAEAHEQGLEVEIKTNDMSDWYSVERVGESHAAAKVLLEKGTARILGAHLLGPEASELINFFGLAMRAGLTATDLKKLVSAYPSAASDLGYLL